MRRISTAVICMLVLVTAGAAHASREWSEEADMSRAGEIERLAFGESRTGFTEVVPPTLVRQCWSEVEHDGALVMTLEGVELSMWRTMPIPPESRNCLEWHFVYEGEIAEGYGRAGLIFGSEDRANLLSVEMTARGSLQIMRWGMDVDSPCGRICWSRPVGISGGRVKLEVDYLMRTGELVCRVDGGIPIRISLPSYMPSGPMTMKHVGFFGAVQEADRSSDYMPMTFPFDIDLRSQYAVLRHRRLAVYGK